MRKVKECFIIVSPFHVYTSKQASNQKKAVAIIECIWWTAQSKLELVEKAAEVQEGGLKAASKLYRTVFYEYC